ncbi:MAG: flagellar basal body-associated FliL family protein [Alphaproteobacteria bacterium]
MADVALDKDAGPTDEAAAAAPAKKGKGLRNILLLAGVPVLLLAGGGGAYVAGVLDPLLGVEQAAEGEGLAAEEEHAGEAPAIMFFDLPDLLVNLNTSGRQNSFLKIQVALELDAEADTTLLTTLMPRIVDSFQVYLRELRPEELKGSEGLYRLKEELLIRVNKAAAPVQVRDVLFRSVLVQ